MDVRLSVNKIQYVCVYTSWHTHTRRCHTVDPPRCRPLQPKRSWELQSDPFTAATLRPLCSAPNSWSHLAAWLFFPRIYFRLRLPSRSDMRRHAERRDVWIVLTVSTSWRLSRFKYSFSDVFFFKQTDVDSNLSAPDCHTWLQRDESFSRRDAAGAAETLPLSAHRGRQNQQNEKVS